MGKRSSGFEKLLIRPLPRRKMLSALCTSWVRVCPMTVNEPSHGIKRPQRTGRQLHMKISRDLIHHNSTLRSHRACLVKLDIRPICCDSVPKVSRMDRRRNWHSKSRERSNCRTQPLQTRRRPKMLRSTCSKGHRLCGVGSCPPIRHGRIITHLASIITRHLQKSKQAIQEPARVYRAAAQ